MAGVSNQLAVVSPETFSQFPNASPQANVAGATALFKKEFERSLLAPERRSLDAAHTSYRKRARVIGLF
jgi:hypothetical protein